MARAIQHTQKGSFKLFHHYQRCTKKVHAFAAQQASVSVGKSCRNATKRRMSSLHDKPQLAWVEAVAFVNGLRLAAHHSPYNGTILFLRLLEASSSANFAHKRVNTDFNLSGCTHKKSLKSQMLTCTVLCINHPKKEQKLGEKNFLQKFIGCRDEPKKVQKQGRDENTRLR